MDNLAIIFGLVQHHHATLDCETQDEVMDVLLRAHMRRDARRCEERQKAAAAASTAQHGKQQ